MHAVADFYEYMVRKLIFPASLTQPKDVVDLALSYFTGAQCDSLIRNATAQIESLLQTASGVAVINKMFNLCTPLNVRYDLCEWKNSNLSEATG